MTGGSVGRIHCKSVRRKKKGSSLFCFFVGHPPFPYRGNVPFFFPDRDLLRDHDLILFVGQRYGWETSRSLQIRRVRCSLIFVWRGMVVNLPATRFTYTDCRPPSQSSSHPQCSKCLTKSRRFFMRLQRSVLWQLGDPELILLRALDWLPELIQ